MDAAQLVGLHGERDDLPLAWRRGKLDAAHTHAVCVLLMQHLIKGKGILTLSMMKILMFACLYQLTEKKPLIYRLIYDTMAK